MSLSILRRVSVLRELSYRFPPVISPYINPQLFFSSVPPRPNRDFQSDERWDKVLERFPKSGGGTSTDAAKVWQEKVQRDQNVVIPLPPNTYTGRTVSVVEGKYQLAYSKLSFILNSNNVWKELRAGRRHENKGDKRRRLKRERWRARFKEEVGSKVHLVKEIRNRGA